MWHKRQMADLRPLRNGARLELLTIFYALMAAMTGFAGGDRAPVAQRVAVVASAQAVATPRLVAVVRRASSPRGVVVAAWRVWRPSRAAARVVVHAQPLSVFTVAGFANRRE